MTDELSPEFLEFSQMLDEEFESTPAQAENDDHKVLLELRDALKDEQATLGLKPDFAKDTAEKVLNRYQGLPFVSRLWSERSHLLFSQALKRSNLKWTGGLMAGGLGLFALDPRLLGIYGLLLALVAGNAVREELFQLETDRMENLREFALSRLVIYLLPALALATSGLAAGAKYARYSQEQSYMGLYMVMGFVASLFLMIPATRLLEHLQASFKERKRVIFWSQIFFLMVGLAMNFALLGTLGSSSDLMSAVSEFLHQDRNTLEAWSILGVWVIAGGFLIRLAVFTPEESLPKLKYRAQGGTRFAWLGSLFFHLLPVTACMASGLLAGSLLYSLGEASLAFREQQSNTGLMAVVGGLGVAFLFRSALVDLWTALRMRARTHPKLMATSLLLHGIWLISSVTLTAYFSLSDIRPAEAGGMAERISFGASVAATLLLIVSCFVTYICTPTYKDLPDLKAARRRLRNTLLLSLIPISLALVVFYQMHLTREIYPSQELHDTIQARVAKWEHFYKTLPPDQNGWTQLRDFFIKDTAGRPDVVKVAETISALSKFEMGEDNNYASLKDEKARAEFQKAKVDFLKLLPRLMKAARMPYYQHISTEGFGFEHMVPNFIRERAVSQCLNLLVEEATLKKNWDDAWKYGIDGLRWAKKGESGSLIEMMIRVAMLAITHSNLEEVVLSGQLTDDQLKQLSQTLKEATVTPQDYQRCMERESVLTSRALEMYEKSDVDLKTMEFTGLNPLLIYMPDSFWESERKAYWNHQLSRYNEWGELNLKPFDDEESEVNPLNVTASVFVPNMKRAPVQVVYSNSKLTALRIQCELERYKLAHRRYPESLQQLEPDFFSELPEDMMKPNKVGHKGTFDYRTTEAGYLLTSYSPLYRRITLNARQVYGHDGTFEERR